jgi:hypothetical protein
MQRMSENCFEASRALEVGGPGYPLAPSRVCAAPMRNPVLFAVFFLGVACQSNGDVSPAGAGGNGGAGAGGGAGGFGVVNPGGGAGGFGTGGRPGLAFDAAATVDGPSSTIDAGACPFSMAGTACAPAGASCASTSECVARRCDCVSGSWACSERQLPCGGMCPAPQQAQCGSACSGNATGCLCHCGGGPNYGGCSCTAGRWQCTCGS